MKEKIYEVITIRNNDGDGGEYNLQYSLNDGWEIERVDASGSTLVYILAKYREIPTPTDGEATVVHVNYAWKRVGNGPTLCAWCGKDRDEIENKEEHLQAHVSEGAENI